MSGEYLLRKEKINKEKKREEEVKWGEKGKKEIENRGKESEKGGKGRKNI